MTTRTNLWIKILFGFLFLFFHIGIIYNFCLLSKEAVLGDSSSDRLLVRPRYNLMRVPTSDLSNQFNALSRILADFAQVYFPACTSSSSAYTSETNDPWKRPSRYAPLVHTVFYYTLCRLPYGYASLLHVLIQLNLLYLSFAYCFRILQIRSYFFPSLLVTNIILFLTPVGLSWFERGQFSIYVTLAYLWLFLGILKRNPYHLFLSALFAFIKWTSFPMIFIVIALWLINVAITVRDRSELKTTLLLAALLPLTIAVLTLFEIEAMPSFLQGLYIQEQTRKPLGLSIAILVPRYFAKSIPFLLVALGSLLIWWKNNTNYFLFMPYLCAAGILSVTYPTLSFDYSTPCLLCFIPLLAYWAELIKKRSAVEPKAMLLNLNLVSIIRRCLPYIPLFLFCSFLLTASAYHSLLRLVDYPAHSIIVFYILGAIVFMFASALLKGDRSRVTDHIANQ